MRGPSFIFGCLLVGLATVSAGLNRVPAGDEWVIRDSPFFRVHPRPLSPGVHFLVPLLHRAYTYPIGDNRLGFDFGGSGDWHSPRPMSREGARIRVQGQVTTRIVPDRLARLHREAGPDYRDRFVKPLLRSHLLERLRSGPAEGTEQGRAAMALELANDLDGPLRDIGLELISLEIDALQPVPVRTVAADGWNRDPALSTARVLLIGWDGADWNIIDRLIDAGRMPNLAGLLQSGTRARLKTIHPILSPVIWTSVATGMSPDRHGIIDFVATDTTTGVQIPVTSNLRRSPALWNFVSDAGLRVGVVGWLATWPAEPVRGFLASDRVTSQLLGFEEDWLKNPEGKVYPSDLWPLIRREMILPDAVPIDDLNRFLDVSRLTELPDPERTAELVEGLRGIVATTRTHTGIHMRIGSGGYSSLEAVYYPGIDRVSHLFMPYRPPRMPWVTEVESAILGAVVDRFYEYQDGLLADLLDRAGPETTVILCSDHGFRSGLDRPRTDPRIGHGRAADWHRKFGILVMQGGPIQPGGKMTRASVLDIAPTVLVLLGLPVPTDLEGRVLVDAFRAEFLQEHPVRYRNPVNRNGGAPPGAGPVASAADETMREQLLSLGYLSQGSLSGHNNLGILHLSHGRVDEAIREFELALEDNPGFVLVRINLGRAHMAKGETDRAREILRGVVLDDPRAKEAWILLAELAVAEGPEVAEQYYLKAVAIDPNDTVALNGLGLLYDRMGRWEEAIRQYQRITQVDPDFEKAYNNVGVIFQRQGRLQEAGAMFERAIEADPDFVGSYNNLGIVQQELGDLEAAERAFRRGLERNPAHPVLRNSLGGVLFRLGRLDEARNQFEIALRIDPDYESAHNNLGAVLGRLGDRPGQLHHYRRAIEIREDYTDARHNLGVAYLETGREAEGLQELEKAIAVDPGHLPSLLRLAEERIRRDETDPAARLLEAAMRSHPDQTDPRNLLGRLRLAEGRLDEARRLFEESLRLNPDQAEIRDQLRDLEAAAAAAGPMKPKGAGS